MFAPFSVPFHVGWWRKTATCSFLLQIYLQWDSPFLMLSQILAVLYWYQPMFLWRFRILFRWPPNISHTAHKSLSRVRITFRAEHITFPQFYWQMCLFNLQLSVGFYSRTTVDISQSAPACCKTAVFTLFEHILPQELKVLYWLVQSGDERRALVKTILFHLDDKWNNLTFQAPPSQLFPQSEKVQKDPNGLGWGWLRVINPRQGNILCTAK